MVTPISQQVFWPQLSLIQMLYSCAEQYLQIRKNAFLFDKGLRTQVLYSKVGSIVLGRLSKLIVISFLFLPQGSFSPKNHLFDSVLLSRIIFMNREQDLFISWNFSPIRRSRFKNKKNLQDFMSMHCVIILGTQRYSMQSKMVTIFINIKIHYNIQKGA